MNASATGARLFLRYACPPNALGFCGPPDSDELLGYGRAGAIDRGLAELVRGFSGAWPYLELIAGATGTPDPLDHRAVEAYWEGNGYLDVIDVRSVANSLAERFRSMVDRRFDDLVAAALAGGVPHHRLPRVLCVPLAASARRRARRAQGADRARPLPDPVGAGGLGAR